MIYGTITILDLGVDDANTYILISCRNLVSKSNIGILENAKTSIISKFPDSAESLFSYVSE